MTAGPGVPGRVEVTARALNSLARAVAAERLGAPAKRVRVGLGDTAGALTIDVESTAFRATQMAMSGEGEGRRIGVTLDSGDGVIIGPEHPLFVVDSDHGPSPRIAVRFGLEAELARPLYYELAEVALAEGQNPPGVWSDGKFFELVP